MTANVDIRALRTADVPAVARLLARAYPQNPDFTHRLRLYLTMQHVRTFVAHEAGAPVGIVVGNDYGSCIYVALMGVDPARQRRGIASALMLVLLAWSDARGAWAELDATEAGAPLYRGFGFLDVGETHAYDGHGGGIAPAGIHPASGDDLDAICAFDRTAFGADRGEVLRAVANLPTVGVLIARARSDVTGFVFAQRGTAQIGPLVAIDDATADRLFAAARAQLDGPLRFNAIAANPGAEQIAQRHGFSLGRRLAHMVRGTIVDAARARLYGRINLGQG
jgi:predicted N-acetyltransferase YhbS